MPKRHAGCFLFCLLAPYITMIVFNRKTIFQCRVLEYECLYCYLPDRVLGFLNCLWFDC